MEIILAIFVLNHLSQSIVLMVSCQKTFYVFFITIVVGYPFNSQNLLVNEHRKGGLWKVEFHGI